jgi:hypothetical protein
MMTIIRWALVTLLLAAPARAQDVVGFYFDTAGTASTASTATTSAPGEFVQGWLILQGASGLDGVGSWRAEVRLELADGSPATAQWMYLGGAQNFDAPPSFDVATFSLMPWEQDLALATVMIQVPDPSETVRVYLAGHRFPEGEGPVGFPLNHPEYGHGPEYTMEVMNRSGGNSYVPVAVINDDGTEPVQAAVSFDSSYLSELCVGMEVSGTVRVEGDGLVRPLEGVVAFHEAGLELRRLPTDSGYPAQEPSPWTTGPVTSRLEVTFLEADDLFEFRTTLTEARPHNFGVTFTTGDVVRTHDHVLEVWPTPCSEHAGIWNTPVGNKLVDGVIEFPASVASEPDPSGYLIVKNFGEEAITVSPALSGSPAFIVTNPAAVSLSPGSRRQLNLAFAPATPGWHEATLSFAGDVCASVTLRGYAVPSVVSDAGDLPGATRLLPAHPNPFNPRTTVSFELARAGRAKLSVYSLDGRLVTVLADGEFAAGTVRRSWSGRDARGRAAASGVYLVRLEAGDVQAVQRVTLLK